MNNSNKAEYPFKTAIKKQLRLFLMLHMIYFSYHYAKFTWLSLLCCLAKYIYCAQTCQNHDFSGWWIWEDVSVAIYGVPCPCSGKKNTDFKLIRLFLLISRWFHLSKFQDHSFYSLNNSLPWCGHGLICRLCFLYKKYKWFSVNIEKS